MTLRNGHNKVVSLQQALPSRITLADALEISRTLAKHDPFVRMTEVEQELANQAGTLLSRMANTEELEFLLRDEKVKVRNFVANVEETLF